MGGEWGGEFLHSMVWYGSGRVASVIWGIYREEVRNSAFLLVVHYE